MNQISAITTKDKSKDAFALREQRFNILEATIKRHQHQQDALIEILHKAQEIFGYLENDVLIYVARHLKLPPSRVYGVATFYHLFSLAPGGVHTCVICTGTPCYVKNAESLLVSLAKSIHIYPGETSADGQISLITTRCLGVCGIAPVVIFDGNVLGNQTPQSVSDQIKGWL